MTKKNGNGNGFAQPPPPPPEPPPLILPYVDSVYNQVTRRLRAARTIFGNRVKLVLRQADNEHNAKLAKPYLLVVPTQVRNPREVDDGGFVNPRVINLIAQFDGRGSEAEHLAANDIDTAERQLIFVLVNWLPSVGYRETLYSGMRILATRAPDVQCVYMFTLYETVPYNDPPIVDLSELPEQLAIESMNVHVNGPCTSMPIPIEPPPPSWILNVTGGAARRPPEPDPCDPACPPILGGDPHGDDVPD